MSARNANSRVTLWLGSLTLTPNARGDLIEELRQRFDLPAQLPNQAYLYRFVRDKCKHNSREHLDELPALYQDYLDHWQRFLNDDSNYKPTVSTAAV